MSENYWNINRAGLINFWYYDEEEFNFADGRLLLRGSNGSGKSVTMQSFIPLLLDGNKSPERLDPFGSKARKLENYLLGEEEFGKDESLGYLFMEFKKKETENYLTIGMGFKAIRGKALKSWGFSITDGRRIGKDFYLYKNVGEKLPLSMKELENRIGSGGQVCESSQDYMKMVNNLLFGFDDIDEYDELVKLLVQLRTPKLSKEFKPTVVYEIMDNSLQQLSEEDLRPMSEAIENMDNIKSKLEELNESKKAADRIKTVYEKYNNYVILEKSKDYLEAVSELEIFNKQIDLLKKEKENSEKAFKEAEENIEQLEIKKKTTEDKKRELDKHDSVGIMEKIYEFQNDKEKLESEKNDKNKQLESKKFKLREIETQIRDVKSKGENQIGKLTKKLEEMNTLADEFAFDEQSFLEDEIKKQLNDVYNFNYIKNNLKNYTENIEKALKVIEEENRKNLQYDKLLQDIDKVKAERDKNGKSLENASLLLSEIKEEYIERIFSWKKENIELMPSDECLIQVSRIINNYNSNSNFDEIIKPLRNEFNSIQGSFNKQTSYFESEKSKLIKDLNEKKALVKQWQSKKDPEPAREEKVTLNRKNLEANGIPYVPFYKAVDFRTDISEQVAGIVEESLLDLGILDALIVPNSYKEKVMKLDGEHSDKYLFSDPKLLSHDLSELLSVEDIDVKGISFEDVDNVLKSILLDEVRDSLYINENGQFGIGIINGYVSKQYLPKYIGTSARKRYKEEIIQGLLKEISEIQENIDEIEAQINELISRLNKLNLEFENFPDNADLKTAINEIKEAQFNYDKSLAEVNKKEVEERIFYQELKEIRQKVHELTHKIMLSVNVKVYEDALEAAKDYKDFLYELEKEHGILLQYLEKNTMLNGNKEELEMDVDNLIYDIGIREKKINEIIQMLLNYENQLKLSDYQAVKAEIEECIKLLKEIPNEINAESRRSEREKANVSLCNEKLNKFKEELIAAEKLKEIFEQSLKEEVSLAYVVTIEENEDINKIAKKISKDINIDEKSQNKEELVSLLYQRFQENSQYLREYNLNISGIFERNIEEENSKIRLALSKGRRLNITAKTRGKEVNYFKLLEFIMDGIEENEKLLKESDRLLFEDILVKNISKKIRAKIYHSEQWVKKMNELMESMNTSSGLSFSLKWSSNKAETEEQLDTKELVELLKQDGALMKEEDLNKLSEHFRSKIAEARRELEDKGKNQSFHSIMREILDYRKWFEFKLFYVKTGQNKKELTNNAFFQFSGGEKAMAMYVPLFSAVYARYNGARKDCPRIISLDEAFAGVDEQNIRDMFRLLNELKLDYVINSQILWGDYDTVPSLSICELIRPDNADFVSVIRYNWNGRVKELCS